MVCPLVRLWIIMFRRGWRAQLPWKAATARGPSVRKRWGTTVRDGVLGTGGASRVDDWTDRRLMSCMSIQQTCIYVAYMLCTGP
jgi:hypothetical protein